jgi:hypothetical protein
LAAFRDPEDLLLQALKIAAIVVPSMLCLSTGVFAEFIATPDFTHGDAERGQRVYQRVGLCVNCHGWPGDGQTGLNPMVHVAGANLRETKLDEQGLFDIIRCGIPGSQMPYHDQASYKDDRCNGLLMSDFAPGERPIRGKTFSEAQLIDLVAYLEKYVVGHGKPTYEDCVLYFGSSADKSCSYLKGE